MFSLLEKVSQNGTTLAKYTYLSDGTKVSATDAAGNGLIYAGSYIFKKTGSSLYLESGLFSAGRLVQGTAEGVVFASFEPHYFLRDHLGSVRVVVNQDGEVLERNDYYPMGMRWDGGQLSDNLYRYNGKEEQGFVNLPYNDYGARMGDPRRGGWLTSDPLLENHPEHGPYVFCGDNPIRFVDMNGMDYFRSESGATVWRDQSCMAIAINDEVFRNIGTTLSMQQVDGSYINYYQGVEVSFSEAPSNAELEILNQPSMMGLLLRNNSPLTPKSQHGLMIAGIHNAQGDFFLTGADIIGTGLEMAGNGLAVIGYGVSATGVGAGTGTIMSGTGNILSFIGGGIRLGVNLKKGNYGQAVIGLVGMGLNFGTGYMAKFGSAGRENIEGGVNLFFSPMNSMVGNVNNNTKR